MLNKFKIMKKDELKGCYCLCLFATTSAGEMIKAESPHPNCTLLFNTVEEIERYFDNVSIKEFYHCRISKDRISTEYVCLFTELTRELLNSIIKKELEAHRLKYYNYTISMFDSFVRIIFDTFDIELIKDSAFVSFYDGSAHDKKTVSFIESLMTKLESQYIIEQL